MQKTFLNTGFVITALEKKIALLVFSFLKIAQGDINTAAGHAAVCYRVMIMVIILRIHDTSMNFMHKFYSVHNYITNISP